MKNKKTIHIFSATMLSASMFAAPLATFAEEDENQDVTSDVVVDGSTDTDVITETESTQEELILVTEDVIFDNLFQFVEALTNNIKLALSNEDGEKAELYIAIAEKHIAQAEELLAEGNEDEAANLFEDALVALANADKISDVIDGEQTEDGTEEESEDANSDEDVVAEDDLETDDVIANDDEAEDSEEGEIKDRIGQNVISLAHNMNKVGNERAKAALKRNIDRALERLEAKYGNIDDLKAELKSIIEPNDEESAKSTEDATSDAESTTGEEDAEDNTSGDQATDEDTEEELVDVEEDESVLDPTPEELKGMQKNPSQDVIKGFENANKGKENSKAKGKAKGKNKD
ncbi:hypothetical protein RZN22_07370 [Bacillaceae bacterium S4-13-58]